MECKNAASKWKNENEIKLKMKRNRVDILGIDEAHWPGAGAVKMDGI